MNQIYLKARLCLGSCGLAALMLLSIVPQDDLRAQNSLRPELFQQYINRIVWLSWHSGEQPMETEGTLKEVLAEANCVVMVVRKKSKDETIVFDGERFLYVNISVIDAFEIRKPRQ